MIAKGTKTNIKTVGIWIRVSTEDQAQGESPLHHEKRARLYAEAKGWHVATLYDLSGVSGKTVMGHPEAKRMLADAASGAITGLIFSKLARLARNTKELLDFAERFREYNADLISLQESIDTSSPAGRLFYTMIAAMAQWEREEISERISASVPIRAKLGKNIGGQASYGYEWKDGKLSPHPEEAPIRKLLYDLFIEHRHKRRVARILNERGYRTRSGAKWSDTTVTRLLRDTTAIGVHRANYTRSQGRGKRAVVKPEGEWVLRDVPAIISEATWQRANALLDAQREGWSRGRPAERLFGGLLWCACGKKMYLKPPSPKYVCRSCSRRIPMDDLEEVFRHELHSFFLSDEDIQAFLEQDDAEIAAKEEQARILELERKKGVAEMDRLYRAFQSDELPGKTFGELHSALKARQEAIDDEVAKLRAEVDLRRINHLSSEEVITGARDLYGRWASLSFAEKRTILETIVEQIVVGDTIEISLAYIPGNSANNATSQHERVAFFPSGKHTISAVIPKPSEPLSPSTLAEHLKCCRQRSGRTRASIAQEMSVSVDALRAWEHGRQPPDRFWPAVITFVGFDPSPRPRTPGQQLQALRRATGLSLRRLARAIGCDERTLAKWESDHSAPGPAHTARLTAAFGGRIALNKVERSQKRP